MDLLKSETKAEMDGKEKQMKMLQQTLKGMQEQLMQSRKQQAQDDQKIKDLTIKLNATKKEEPRESEIITLDKDDDISEEPRTPKQHMLVSNLVQVTQKDAKLIGKYIKVFLMIWIHRSHIEVRKTVRTVTRLKCFCDICRAIIKIIKI